MSLCFSSLLRRNLGLGLASLALGCGDAGQPSGPSGPTQQPTTSASTAAITFRSDVVQVTRIEDAKPGVFIPPFLDCRDPKPGETGSGPNGKVCTNVAVSGCTEPGKYFPDYASCDVVRTQRPFWVEAPAKEPRSDDPRLQDASYMKEFGWVTQQLAACACTCCHDARTFAGKFGQWDISHSGIWLDTLSDSGLALFTGLADSHVLGAYPPDQNHGFDRSVTGVPSTEPKRMQTFMLDELKRRGLTTAQAAAVPPFGGPIYAQSIAQPTACRPGEGVTSAGQVRWLNSHARYVYVLEAGSKNPGVPPNLDVPEGTLWKLDVLANADAIESGVTYGTTPPGSFQSVPDHAVAPALVKGTTYHLSVLADVGLPVANCLFVFGEADADPSPPSATPGADAGPSRGDAGASGAGGTSNEGGDAGSSVPATCSLPGGDTQGFGVSCTTDAECSCQANYCAVQPGTSTGYCTVKGCNTNAGLCPSGWDCFDLSIFSAGLPAICRKP